MIYPVKRTARKGFDWKSFRGLKIELIILLLMICQGCAFGYGVSMLPQVEKSELQCGDISIRHTNSSISGWEVPYYIIPFWFLIWDKTDENLELSIYFKSHQERVHLTGQHLYIEDKVKGVMHFPVNIKLHNDMVYENIYMTTYRIIFDVRNKDIDVFELNFDRPILNCSPKPVKFVKGRHKIHYQLLGR